MRSAGDWQRPDTASAISTRPSSPSGQSLRRISLQMRRNIADALRTDIGNISVKATTEERLGFTGSGEGIAAHTVCLIE